MTYASWQPIETAPKMRTILLFAVSDVGEQGEVKNWKMATGSWHSGYDDERSKEQGITPWEWDGHQLKVYELHPTHWMPLPPSPENNAPCPMNAKHTPGPWRLWLSVDDRGMFIVHGDSLVPHCTDMVICQRTIGTPDGDEGVANARLIAAAPEILAALKELCAAWITTDREDMQARWARAEAAIQKAEGAA